MRIPARVGTLSDPSAHVVLDPGGENDPASGMADPACAMLHTSAIMPVPG